MLCLSSTRVELMSNVDGGSNKKRANHLVVMSSAAVLAVYAAGYSHTRVAADRLAAQFAAPRPLFPDGVPGRPTPTADFPRSIAAQSAGDPATKSHSAEGAAHLPAATPHAIESASHLPKTESSGAPAEKPADIAKASSPAVPMAIAVPPLAAPAGEPAPSATEVKSKMAVAPPALAVPNKPVWNDGTYLGWGHCMHGTIQASVVVEGGRIASATIVQCYTRYPCSVISMLPPQVIQRQSPDVDRVSTATESADAFYFAVVDALEKAR